ncbi:hypothetical protein Pan216_33230 [Planctomycetes bacterium Pan216]|uniref:Translocation protein TolB n=1 Tax=Kolteria novifilia TaxID=2527975 RepID=A0A518B663_9BACT|nr:hypothetical protein Pan216_33230 [Planctomycetes bacterium Pan216]
MRRAKILVTAMVAAWLLIPSLLLAADPPKARTVTHGPKHHWFGYYDKLQFDPSSRYLLGMEVDFEGRSPKADDVIKIGMVDLEDGDRWIELGESNAWGWQQGCMLQWIPGSENEILWNDREGDGYVCRILNVDTKKMRTIPSPIYTLSPDGKSAITSDFRRINDMRPGYGYAGLADPYADQLAPSESGIWRVDLETGDRELIVPLSEIVKLGPITEEMKDAKHYFNHLLYNTDGSRIVFLHRWRPDGGKGNFRTRMVTANPDGSDLYVLDPSGNTSHFIWKDPDHILAWTKPAGRAAGFWRFRDKTKEIKLVGEGAMPKNGHNTYLADTDWILNDTYPQGKDREQEVYLYHVPTFQKVSLGRFHSPKSYSGEWRCDTHPRSNPDGTLICIDSPHTGEGRQMHIIDISEIVKKKP